MSSPRRPRIAFVSREVGQLGGGGIGTYVATAAEALAPVADVTVFTTTRHRSGYERLQAAGDPVVADAELVFVAEPRAWDIGETDAALSLWSARVFEALCERYPDGGPDLVEFPDYLGEGFVTTQARACGDRRIANTTICVRAYTTGELTSVLDGHVSTDFEDRVTHQIERYALAHCDHFLWPGGDVLGTYERYFGAGRVAAPIRMRHPLTAHVGAEATTDGPRAADGTLRLLYCGRLERRKGVANLARALTGIGDPRLRVTLLGGDTQTAPLGESMRNFLEIMLGGDERVEFVDRLPRERLPALFAAHDAVILPSLWECWPAVGLEALERNRPILATRTGGFAEMVQPGRSGWFVDDQSPEALARAVERLLAEPGEISSLTESGGPRSLFEELTAADEIRDGYLALAAERPAAPGGEGQGEAERPLVTVVIPYFKLERFIEATVSSVAAQTYPASRIETVIVNDGSMRAADAVVFELAERYGARVLTQVNSGLGAARSAGLAQAAGEYVLFLDADNMLASAFIERAVEVLEGDPQLAYVTSWARYVDERGEPWPGSQAGYRPLGNWTPLVHDRNVAGDAMALFRRSVFAAVSYSPELTSFEDWALYRAMHERGLFGTVIPERLLDYRIRGDSMLRQIGAPNQERIEGEIRARILEEEMQWTAPA